MSNYLQNLIAKSFNQVEVARPRVASMFEPLSPSTPAAFGENRPLERLDFASATGDGQSTGTVQERKDRGLEKALQLATRNQSSPDTGVPVWRGNQQPVTFQQQTVEAQILRHQTTQKQRIDFQPGAPQEVESAPQESGPSKLRFSNSNQSGRQPARRPEEETRPEGALLPDEAGLGKEGENSLQNSLQPHSKRPVPSLMQNAPEQIRRPINKPAEKQGTKESSLPNLPLASQANRIGLQPRIALPAESQKASGNLTPDHHLLNAQPGEIQAAPTINVTIGRIEIRAITPASQPRKQPPGAQTMSLDEYLHQRNRGGAR
jgi:hypothetical protein